MKTSGKYCHSKASSYQQHCHIMLTEGILSPSGLVLTIGKADAFTNIRAQKGPEYIGPKGIDMYGLAKCSNCS